MEFSNWFEGKYNNWKQASSNPHSFAHVLLEHNRVSENVFNIVQWYPGKKPYRDTLVKIHPQDGFIIVENDVCNYIFQKKNGIYRGAVVPGCVHNGAVLISKAELSETQYKVVDLGVDPKTKKVLWGSHHGHFIFDKI
jgi:hypothetical protein|tara:strand:+ start:180 stop:593 length:414 start_codon:yes stop_codon:yes gene_type:complete